ncbi:lysophospholipid acyltransferase family protein [Pedobacter insulae]|uniref:1-acyl-sn-glycerol-3-phosphate acyltransferase n=1 Tax=Pedobacter insulae TaxID=414048 RepID=A0A1I2SSB0_9SPHI|nr:lysophospholipid acyltransferase family protein [Pedobacter insulae]SFG55754.1 1-acyl-sn-glycerol-3-phosphate acyltransferase [Pedobacter insulae]
MAKVLSALYLLYAGMIFIALMFIALPFVLAVTTLCKPLTGKRLGLFFLRCWAWGFSLLSFYWVNTKNAVLVNRSTPHIYVGNHGSYLDAIAVCISVPQSFSALGKIEMASIPIFGWIYKRMVIMLDRSNKESRERSVLTLKAAINAGQSILLFPEGTMNKTAKPLGDFYDGAFRIAIETQTPLQPFVILNNRKLLSRVEPLSARPGLITTVFLPAVEVAGYRIEEVDLLKRKIYAMMEEVLLKGY